LPRSLSYPILRKRRCTKSRLSSSLVKISRFSMPRTITCWSRFGMSIQRFVAWFKMVYNRRLRRVFKPMRCVFGYGKVSTLLSLANYLKNIISISGKCCDTASSSWWSEVTNGDLRLRAVTSPKQSAREMRLIVALRFPASCQNGSDISSTGKTLISLKFCIAARAVVSPYSRT